MTQHIPSATYPTTEDTGRLDCRCGWSVYPGLDCDFCETPAEDVIAYAESKGATVTLRLL